MARRVVALVGMLLLPLVAEAKDLQPLAGALHTHSTFSTGDLPLDRLAAEVRSRGLEVLLLTENYLLRVEYGLWPVRGATRVIRERPSVLSRGVQAYLDRVSEVRRRFPDMVVVPGVEVIPHYHWTGTPLTGDLTLHNLQKNLLVFGITDPEALRRLPSTGNPHLGRYRLGSVVDGLPGLLVVPGLWLLLIQQRRERRVGGFKIVERRRRWLAGTVLIIVGVLASLRAFPLREDPWSPYRPDTDLAAHQALIDQVESWGGVTVWSFPEARDSFESSFLGLTVRGRTDPYPDDLIRTFRYTAFGAVYEDTTRFTTPGERWDYLLGKYVSGERSRPPWAVGESGFHGYTANKRVESVQTVFLVHERSEAGVLESLRAGRMYALRRGANYALELRSFVVRQGRAEASLGETLAVSAGTPLQIEAGVEASDGGEYPVRALLIQDGRVVRVWSGKTPLRIAHVERTSDTPSYFRLEVRGPLPHHVLSNPIFVKPRQAP